ncbi:RNA pyrophosphohydrolase [Roseitranquillus sediminis]|uniref:RNA pyrophosphohydrolase n=1 Tax=Roseitranquillus sediminis TaxID=2809051 RepID=UPI001D0CC0C7|nr:RNA pyrophosphohydrolase [Roseitranquillus sediminis]MBM9596194.1 RNA pyrophosphohydrolase [Roseitranquillus sediminis]
MASLPYRPCVGVVLANPAGLVFAGERLDTPGAWQMPQGGIDAGEAPSDAALRELREETGLSPEAVALEAETPDWISYDLPDDLIGRVWGGRYRGQRQKWFLMRYGGPDSAVDLAAHEVEFGRWRWMAPADLMEHIVPFKRDVYRAVFDAFANRLLPS